MSITTVAAKDLPGVLEIAVLQHLPLEPSSRYTITTVSRYIITAVGFIIACGIIGMTWSSIQWLVAALSVGLGFGLQEIVANFVSGLILLFERPIRVGDTVTVGSVSGKVSRIRIRATTITRVLENPSPQVFFQGFGDNTLNFEVRVFVSRQSDCWPVRHELHCAIDAAFREKKIEIAFPQRDIHIRSMDIPFPLEKDREEKK